MSAQDREGGQFALPVRSNVMLNGDPGYGAIHCTRVKEANPKPARNLSADDALARRSRTVYRQCQSTVAFRFQLDDASPARLWVCVFADYMTHVIRVGKNFHSRKRQPPHKLRVRPAFRLRGRIAEKEMIAVTKQKEWAEGRRGGHNSSYPALPNLPPKGAGLGSAAARIYRNGNYAQP